MNEKVDDHRLSPTPLYPYTDWRQLHENMLQVKTLPRLSISVLHIYMPFVPLYIENFFMFIARL